jgi:hypothetical protein
MSQELDQLITEYLRLVDVAEDEPNEEEDKKMSEIFAQIATYPNGSHLLQLRIIADMSDDMFDMFD